MFSGSKRSFDVAKDANCNEIYPGVVEGSEAMEEEMLACPRQMMLTSSGELTHPVTEDKPTNAFQALMMAKQCKH